MDTFIALAALGLLLFCARMFARIADYRRFTTTIKEIIMTASQDTVDKITTQLGKAKSEIVGEIGKLKAQVEAGETPDFSGLESVAQALDDIVPDPVVVPDPEPETPVEPESPVDPAES